MAQQQQHPHAVASASTSASSPTSHSTELQLLLDEKNRLMRRVQEKEREARTLQQYQHQQQQQHQHQQHGYSGALLPTNHQPLKQHHLKQRTVDEQREAGFNVYISGANEERVKDQRRREKSSKRVDGTNAAAGAAARPTKTWSKPSPPTNTSAADSSSATAAQSHPSTSQQTHQHDAHDNEQDEQLAAPAIHTAAASSPTTSAVKPKRKQWDRGPVMIGESMLSAPTQHQRANRRDDDVDRHQQQEQEGDESASHIYSHAQQRHDDQDYIEDENEHEPISGGYEDDDFETSPSAAVQSLSKSSSASKLPQHMNSRELRESIQEDIVSLRERLAAATTASSYDEESHDDQLQVHEEDDGPSTAASAATGGASVAPLSLRKKDVSLLRESLEEFNKKKPNAVSDNRPHAISVDNSQQRERVRLDYDARDRSYVTDAQQEMGLYDDEMTPFASAKTTHRSNSSLSQYNQSQSQLSPPAIPTVSPIFVPAPTIASGQPLPAPVSSSSPTLPTRSLKSSSSSGAINASPTGGPQASPDSLSEGYTNVRTSISFDNGDANLNGGKRADRPSTPTSTDNSILRTSLLLSQSFDKSSVETFLQRFQSLPTTKRQRLLEVLEELEKGDMKQVPSELKESLELLNQQHNNQNQSQPKNTSQKHLQQQKARHEVAMQIAESTKEGSKLSAEIVSPLVSPPHASKLSLLKQKQSSTAVDPSSSPQPPQASPSSDEVVTASFAAPIPHLSVRVLSSWSHPSSIGLTQIELYDAQKNKLRVPPSCLHFVWTPNHPSLASGVLPPTRQNEVAKIVSGKNPRLAQEEKNVWSFQASPQDVFPVASLASQQQHGFDLQFYLPSFFPTPAYMVIYNYNLPNQTNRGVRNVEVSVAGRRVWTGEVKKGPGVENTEYGVKIRLRIKGDTEEETPSPTKERSASTTAAAAPMLPPLVSSLPLAGVTVAATSKDTPNSSTTSSTAPSPPQSSRPLWLQGPSMDAASTSDLLPTNASNPTMTHSVSTSVLPARRRASGARETGQSDSASALSSTTSFASSSGMVPPLLPATSWQHDPTSHPVPPPSDQKRPMSGRRAVAPSMSSSLSTSALPSHHELSKRVPSAGRRRPVPPAAPIDSSSPSFSPPVGARTLVPAAVAEGDTSDAHLPAYSSATSAAVASRQRRSDLEESWDSLEHFKHHHHGRLEPAVNASMTMTSTSAATATSNQSLLGSKSAATLPTVQQQRGDGDRANGTRRIKHEEADELNFDLTPTGVRNSVNTKSSMSSLPSSTFFSLPTLPLAQRLTFSLLTTYGDAYYIGLSGIEIFDDSGRLLKLNSKQIKSITAFPRDINILPGYSNDPRVITNLLDGTNATCDDLHVWLAPYSAGKRHIILIELHSQVRISCIRVWNYNKSRIHSTRGVKDLEIWSDVGSGGSDTGNNTNTLIFRGQITQAPGSVEDAGKYSENILFTTDAKILTRIAATTNREAEKATNGVVVGGGSNSGSLNSSMNEIEFDQLPARPPTAGTRSNSKSNDQHQHINVHASVDMSLARPKTSAVPGLAPSQSEANTKHHHHQDGSPAKSDHSNNSTKSRSSLSTSTIVTTSSSISSSTTVMPSIRGTEICIYLISTWGDVYFVGLTGLEVLNEHMQPIPLTLENLSAYPQDINTVPGHSGDNRTLDKLINGTNQTCNDNNMWLTPILQSDDIQQNGSAQKVSHPSNKYGEQWLRIRLPAAANIAALRLWNYNKSEEDTYRGMKLVHVTVDGKLLSPPQSGYFIRKAPGNTDFNFGQTLYLQNPSVDAIPQAMRKQPFDFSMPIMPCGSMLKFLLLSTYGDSHYIGLNGLELYDHHGKRISVQMSNICAVPSSLNDLHPDTQDTRTVDKLFDGINDTYDDRHMWLAPLVPSNAIAASQSTGLQQQTPIGHARNILYIFFNSPIALSCIKLWNYSKTPGRGVYELQVLMDEAIIYDGVLKQAPNVSSNGNSKSPASWAQSLLFTSGLPSLVTSESANQYRDLSEQSVLLVNERKYMNQPTNDGTMTNANSSVPRPQTMMNKNLARQ